ncbi:MAG: TolC family protein [Thiobacillus sp.]|nr:TolC family protein [Thiobacillus sp.]
MSRLLLVSLLTFSAAVQAVEPVSPPGLLPTETARALLEQDPGVAAARAGLEVARQEAGILDQSPYEWTTRVTGQRRVQDYGPGDTSTGKRREWSAGIERTVRLPGKAVADRNIGKATVEASQAGYGEALHEAARELMALWVDWLAAERARELAENNLRLVEESLAAVEKRARAGDASKLDLSIARAERAEQKRLYNDAKTQAAAARSRLATRFPGAERQLMALPAPLPTGKDAAFWRDRILAESDELKVAQAQMRTAQAHAERARADKMPDPTLGVYTASEIDGRERVAGVAISIPIPGGVRDSRSARAIAAIEVSRQEVELKQRQLEADIASAVATAQGAYDSLQIANEGAAAMQENASLMQRAYALGEAELQALLLARRQATAALNNALQAQVTALRAYYGLLVDAHLIWGLEHD